MWHIDQICHDYLSLPNQWYTNLKFHIFSLSYIKVFFVSSPGSSKTRDMVRVLKMLQVPGTLVQYKINDDCVSPTTAMFFFSFQISATVKSCRCSNGRANVLPSNCPLLRGYSSVPSFCLLFIIAWFQDWSTSSLITQKHKSENIIMILNNNG